MGEMPYKLQEISHKTAPKDGGLSEFTSHVSPCYHMHEDKKKTNHSLI